MNTFNKSDYEIARDRIISLTSLEVFNNLEREFVSSNSILVKQGIMPKGSDDFKPFLVKILRNGILDRIFRKSFAWETSICGRTYWISVDGKYVREYHEKYNNKKNGVEKIR